MQNELYIKEYVIASLDNVLRTADMYERYYGSMRAQPTNYVGLAPRERCYQDMRN